jgi:glutamine amidotransferase
VIAVVGYGMGNVQSVVNALDHVGARHAVVTDPSALARADKILLPGVGAFRAAMERLAALGFVDALQEAVRGRGRPVLGICLGMQLLAETGTEFGETSGLGWIAGRVEPIDRTGHEDLRLLHVGWSALRVERDDALLRGLGDETSCYFVHSYHLKAVDPAAVSATCVYGGRVTAAVSADHVFGVQFHPEKSQRVGLQILRNFAAL